MKDVERHKTPVLFVGFNRPRLLVRAMSNVADCHGAVGRDMLLYIDGPRDGNQEDLRKVDETFHAAFDIKATRLPSLQIIRRDRNLGCRGNIISAIGDVVNRYGKVIVVEDDVLVSRTFLEYMDEALEMYSDDQRIWCINAYQNPNLKIPRSVAGDVYLAPRNMCWGWGVWSDRWNAVDFDMKDWPQFSASEKNKEVLDLCGLDLFRLLDTEYQNPTTWDLQCSYHMSKNGLMAVEPLHSMTKNIGIGIEGTHSWRIDWFLRKQRYYNIRIKNDSDIRVNGELMRNYRNICFAPWGRRLLRRLRDMMYSSPLIGRHDNPINYESMLK